MLLIGIIVYVLVTVAMLVVGKISWKEVPGYLISQFLGAGIGALLILLNYSDSFAEVSLIF